MKVSRSDRLLQRPPPLRPHLRRAGPPPPWPATSPYFPSAPPRENPVFPSPAAPGRPASAGPPHKTHAAAPHHGRYYGNGARPFFSGRIEEGPIHALLGCGLRPPECVFGPPQPRGTGPHHPLFGWNLRRRGQPAQPRSVRLVGTGADTYRERTSLQLRAQSQLQVTEDGQTLATAQAKLRFRYDFQAADGSTIQIRLQANLNYAQLTDADTESQTTKLRASLHISILQKNVASGVAPPAKRPQHVDRRTGHHLPGPRPVPTGDRRRPLASSRRAIRWTATA